MNTGAFLLDPKTIIHVREEGCPVFDATLKDWKGGTTFLPDLLHRIENRVHEQYQNPEDETQSFPAITNEMALEETCAHSVPVTAACTWCLEGVANSAEPNDNTVQIISRKDWRPNKTYGKTNRGWFSRAWAWVKEH